MPPYPPTASLAVFTAGFSTLPPERFLNNLRTYDIQLLADVRSRPYSRHAPQFNKEQAERLARGAGLEGVVLVMQANPDIEDFGDGKGRIAYRGLLTQLLAETRRFSGQVLLVHGDSHVHRIDTPLRDPKDGSTVGNFTRVETFGSPFMGWVKVDVTPGSKRLFRPIARPYVPKTGD